MRIFARAASGLILLAASLGVAACAPRHADTTPVGQDIGRPASVGYGTIVSVRPVVQGGNPGAGGIAGGNDVRSSILGAIGGGTGGNAVANQVGRGGAVEFILHEDDGQTVSVVQTNEDNFRPGERVVMTRGARTRLARAAAPPAGT